MTERQLNIYNQATATILNGAKSLKVIALEVNRFFEEQSLGSQVSQAEVLDAVFALGPKSVKVYDREQEVWLERVSVT